MFWERYVDLCNQNGEAPNVVAAKCGVKSTGTVTGWSNGAKPRAGVLKRISDYFGVSISYLLGEEEKAPPKNGDAELNEYLEELRTRPEMKMLFHTFKGATKEEIQAIVAAWEAMNKRGE